MQYLSEVPDLLYLPVLSKEPEAPDLLYLPDVSDVSEYNIDRGGCTEKDKEYTLVAPFPSHPQFCE